MEPEPDPIDLSVLDPARDRASFDRAIAVVAARARELHRFRRAVVRRGVTALVLAAAAGLALWLSAPRHHAGAPRVHGDILGWAVRDADAAEVLGLGGNHAE